MRPSARFCRGWTTSWASPPGKAVRLCASGPETRTQRLKRRSPGRRGGSRSYLASLGRFVCNPEVIHMDEHSPTRRMVCGGQQRSVLLSPQLRDVPLDIFDPDCLGRS